MKTSVEIGIVRYVSTPRSTVLPECRIVSNAEIQAEVGTPHYAPDILKRQQQGDVQNVTFILHENASAHISVDHWYITIIHAGIVLGCFVYGSVAFQVKVAQAGIQHAHYVSVATADSHYAFCVISDMQVATIEAI